MFISSRQNPIIKSVVSLLDKKGRKEERKYLVEGYKMVNEAIINGEKVESIFGTEDGLKKLDITPNCKVYTVSDSVIDCITDSKTPQGVVAVIEKQNKPLTLTKPCVLLDGVSDPGNMGTIFRTCAAVGIEDLILVGCVDPYSPKCIRSSMSGIFFVNILETDEETARNLIKDIPLIVADMNGKNVFEFNPPEKYCLVIGNEANGVSKGIKNLAEITVKIPMSKHTESLNAGVSLAITLYELTEGKGRSLIK